MSKVVTFRGGFEEIGSNVLPLLFSLAQSEANWRTYLVADATSDESVDLAGIATVDVFLITADQDITYKLNGSSDAITLDANGVHILFGTSITAVTVSNASGSTANVTVFFAG